MKACDQMDGMFPEQIISPSDRPGQLRPITKLAAVYEDELQVVTEPFFDTQTR
jgi:hypothetical protein